MRDRQHDAIFAFKRDRRMGGTGVVDNVLTRAHLTPRVAITTLEDEDLFDAAVAMSRITAAGLHPNQNCRVAALLIAPENVDEDSLVTRRLPGN